MLNGNRTKSNRGRSPRDFYETPIELAISAITRFAVDEDVLHKDIYGLDAGCGRGIWGLANISMPNKLADGVDIKIPNDTPKYAYVNIYKQDFLDFERPYKYDIVFGNPPYSLAREFIEHAYYLVNDGGYVYFLLRLSFLEGIERGKNFFKFYPLKRVYVSSRRPSFFSIGNKHTTDTLAYAMFLWQKGYRGKPELDWLDWNYENV